MAFEWPWQRNDATGRTHFAESFTANKQGVFVRGLPIVVNPAEYWPANIKTSSEIVGTTAGRVFSGATGGLTNGFVGGLAENKTGFLVLAALGVGAVLLLSKR